MSLGSFSVSLGCVVGGAFLTARGIKKTYNIQTRNERIKGIGQICLGALAMIGGAYSLIGTKKTQPSYRSERTLTEDQVKEACEKVFTKGYEEAWTVNNRGKNRKVTIKKNGKKFESDQIVTIPPLDISKHIQKVRPSYWSNACNAILTKEGRDFFKGQAVPRRTGGYRFTFKTSDDHTIQAGIWHSRNDMPY